MGQKIFIQAGSGGVGAFAIQLAKHLGATVATTASTANIALVKSSGADVVIDYKSGTQLREITRIIDEGAIRPVIDKGFSFEATNDALAYVEAGRAKGKVVVKIIEPRSDRRPCAA